MPKNRPQRWVAQWIITLAIAFCAANSHAILITVADLNDNWFSQRETERNEMAFYVDFNNLMPVSLNVSLQSDDWATELIAFSTMIDNSTGTDWAGFTLELTDGAMFVSPREPSAVALLRFDPAIVTDEWFLTGYSTVWEISTFGNDKFTLFLTPGLPTAAAQIPEPATWALFVLGLMCAAPWTRFLRARRQRYDGTSD